MVAVAGPPTSTVVVDCPACGLPLPPIAIEFDVHPEGPRSLVVSVREPVLTDEWWARAFAAHPDCRSGDAARWSPE